MTDNTSNSEIYDHAGFLNRMMGDEALAAEIMAEFLVDMYVQIQRLKTECTVADIPTLVRLAHTVKGASANVGAKEMQRTALLAEQAAAKGDLEKYTVLALEIETRLIELKSLLSRMGYLKGSPVTDL